METPAGGAAVPEDDLRRRIAEIYDEIGALPRDKIAERAILGAERDALAAQLRSAPDQALWAQWSERAARGDEPLAAPVIASHGEGGGAHG